MKPGIASLAIVAVATVLYSSASSQAQVKPTTTKSLAQQMLENQKGKQGVQQDKSIPLTKVTQDGKLNVFLYGVNSIGFSVKDPPPTEADGIPLKFKSKGERVYFRLDTPLSTGNTRLAWRELVKLESGVRYKAAFWLRQFDANRLVIEIKWAGFGDRLESQNIEIPAQPQGRWLKAQFVFTARESSANFVIGIPPGFKGKCDICDVRLDLAGPDDKTGVIVPTKP